MARVQFNETVTIPGGPIGTLIPVPGIAATPYNVNPDGTEGSQVTTYVDRTSLTHPTSLLTNASGKISFWLEPGDYNVHIDDPQSPPRIASYIVGFTAPVIDTSQLVIAAQNLIQFTGDTKFSMQTADHGLKPDGTFEWLIMVSNADGGGRKLDPTIYPGIYSLMGSPALDGSGLFRLPNVSGRALIAAGAATGLNPITLMQIIGALQHSHTAELTIPGLNASIVIPSLVVNPHSHTLASGGAEMWVESGGGPFKIAFAQNGSLTENYSGYFDVGAQNENWNNIPLSNKNPIALVGATDNSSGSTTATGTSTTTASGLTSGSTDSTSSYGPSFGMNLFVKS